MSILSVMSQNTSTEKNASAKMCNIAFDFETKERWPVTDTDGVNTIMEIQKTKSIFCHDLVQPPIAGTLPTLVLQLLVCNF